MNLEYSLIVVKLVKVPLNTNQPLSLSAPKGVFIATQLN